MPYRRNEFIAKAITIKRYYFYSINVKRVNFQLFVTTREVNFFFGKIYVAQLRAKSNRRRLFARYSLKQRTKMTVQVKLFRNSMIVKGTFSYSTGLYFVSIVLSFSVHENVQGATTRQKHGNRGVKTRRRRPHVFFKTRLCRSVTIHYCPMDTKTIQALKNLKVSEIVLLISHQ